MNPDIGDEIIVPAYTYVASATAVLQNNCVPIFVDIHPDTYNIDPERIEEAITDRTCAVMVVHFGGQPAAEKHNIPGLLRTSLNTVFSCSDIFTEHSYLKY